MQKTRESLMFAGLLIFMVGGLFRCFDTVQLNEEATRIAAKYTAKQTTASFLNAWQSAPVTTSLSVPAWLGWSCLCAGSVLILESFVTPKKT